MVGYDQSWICEFWIRAFTSYRSRCSRSRCPSPRLVCSDRPEGSSTQAVSALCVRGSSISVQGPTLRAGPVSPRLHESRGGSPCSHERTGRPHPQLSRRLAQSREQLCEHRDLVLSHLSQLGLQVNWEKSKLAPVQRISFLGIELDSVEQSARLTEERAQSVLNCLNTFRGRTAVPLKLFQRLLGHMAAAAAVTPLGLLHMRPLQHWLHGRVSRWAWQRGTYRVAITLECRQTFSPWSDPLFLRAGVALEQVSRHAVVFTDASATGWGATYNGQAVSGVWTGPQRHWHINCLELLAVYLALGRLKGPLRDKHVLVRTDNTADRCVHQPSRRSVLPSHVATRPPSPPLESEASEVASRHSCPWCAQPCGRRALTSCATRRVATPPPGGPADLGGVRRGSGRPVCLARNLPLPVVLLPVRGDTRYRCTGAQLAPGPSQVCVSPSEPTCTDLVQSQGGRGAGLASCALLAQPDLVPGTLAPRDSPSLASSSEKGPSFSETGHPLAPASRPLETPCLVPGRDAVVLGDLPPEVLNTIASARAPSTRRAYALKWNLFVKWCSSRREDPRRCSIGVVLSFLQQGLERRLSPSTLKVHAAAISTYHDHIDGKSIGKHDLVVRFLRGARRLNPPRPPSIPSWDLALVLRALQIAPFEPLQSADLRILSMKTLLLVALASIKRVGDLQAFSVDESCLEFGPGDGHVLLSPRPDYVPKVPTTPFRDQVVSLQALPLEEADPALALLCPVRALRLYTDRTQSLRTSDQLFVCYGGQQKGKAVSKQRMAHWIVDAIALAYQAQGVPCPLRLRAHSTRGVASSWALARGASLTFVELRAGRHLTRSLDSIAFMSSRSPPVFSPQVRGTERYRLSVGLLRYIRLLLQRVPIGRPCWVLQSPFGSQTWRSARRQAFTPLYPWEPDLGWVRYVWPYRDPICVIPRVAPKQTRVFPSGRTHLSSGWSHPSASICSTALQG